MKTAIEQVREALESAHHHFQNILDYGVAQGSDRDKVRAEQDILRAALTALKSLEGQGWISVDERLPEERCYPDDEHGYPKPDGRSAEVLMGHLPLNGKQFNILDLGFYSHKEQAWVSKKGMLCTHWMPLPSAPALTKSANP